MKFSKIGTGSGSINPQAMCANGNICPHATVSMCREAGYSGQSQWYETYVVQKSVGGLTFK